MNRVVYVTCFIAVLVSNVSYFSYLQPTYVGWLFNATLIVAVFILLPSIFPRADKMEKLYLAVMLLGFVLHLSVQNIDNKMYDAAKWVLPVFLLMGAKKYDSKFSFYLLTLIFGLHCIVAINEYLTQQYFINYFYTDVFDEYYKTNAQFRAFGLMAHPLYGANITLIVMAFLLVSRGVNIYLRLILISLGSYALVCFNSRAAMMVWAALVIYRLFFYKRKPIIAISIGVVAYLFFLSDLFALLLQSTSGMLGRLGEANNLTDSSASARVISFAVFATQNWNFNDIIVGARIFYLPGTTLSLENGLLLTIAWWGWIVGGLKVFLELMISWRCLANYEMKDKFIVLIATWICAYSNNNTVNSFVFSFFIISFISIKYDAVPRQLKKVSYRPAWQ